MNEPPFPGPLPTCIPFPRSRFGPRSIYITYFHMNVQDFFLIAAVVAMWWQNPRFSAQSWAPTLHQPAAAVYSRPLMEVKVEVISDDEVDDPGVAVKVEVTSDDEVDDPGVAHVEAAYDDKAEPWLGRAPEEARRPWPQRQPWRKRDAADPPEPFDEEQPSKRLKPTFPLEPECQSWITRDAADAPDTPGEEQRWHYQPWIKTKRDAADATDPPGEEQPWQRQPWWKHDAADAPDPLGEEQWWQHQPWIDAVDAPDPPGEEQPWPRQPWWRRDAADTPEPLDEEQPSMVVKPTLPMGPPPTVAAGIICTRRSRAAEVLAIRRGSSWFWSFPKGRREFDKETWTWEPIIETAYREFEEETGICWTGLTNQRSEAIDFGTQTYPTRFEAVKMVHWFWLHLDDYTGVDEMLQRHERATREVRWFTMSQMWHPNNRFVGGYAMQELAAQALGFAIRKPTSRLSIGESRG